MLRRFHHHSHYQRHIIMINSTSRISSLRFCAASSSQQDFNSPQSSFSKTRREFDRETREREAPDLSETTLDYRPRARPRNIVMPIDFESLHDDRRTLGADFAAEKIAAGVRKQARNSGSVKLGQLPDEHTFADIFGSVLENVKKRDEINEKRRRDRRSSSSANEDEEVTTNNNTNERKLREETFLKESKISKEATSAFLDLANEDNMTKLHNDGDNDELSSLPPPHPNSYQVWDALEQVPISSPFGGGLGVLSSSGYSLVQLEVTSYITHMYPRLRSRHIESLLHSVIGFQPMVRLATEIGIVSLAKLETDAALWKELCNLHQREHHLRDMLHLHRARLDAGLPQNQAWFYKQQLKWLSKKLNLFPTDASTLLPRIEWLRNTTLAFIGWLEFSEGEVAAQKFVEENICSLFDVVDGGEEEEESTAHPLDARLQRAAHRKSTTSDLVGAEPFEDPFLKYSARMLSHLACRRLVEAVTPQNALKEAQFILNYSPFVPRDEGRLVMISAEDNVVSVGENENTDNNTKKKQRVVKFDIQVRSVNSPILDSASMSSDFTDPENQQFQQGKCLEADLIIFERVDVVEDDGGDHHQSNGRENEKEKVIGTGIGVTEQEAMQACCLDFVRRYYFTSS